MDHPLSLKQNDHVYENERKHTFLESINDDQEDKTNSIQQNDQFRLEDKRKVSNEKSGTRSDYVQLLIRKTRQIQLTKHEIIMIILNILMIFILIIVLQFFKKSSLSILIGPQEELVMKEGDIHGGPGGEKLLNDADIASLTFSDTISRITASQQADLNGEIVLLSLTFTYSNGKDGQQYGGIGRHGTWEDLDSFQLTPEERIDQITIYQGYRNIVNPWRNGKPTYIIVGIHFKTDGGHGILYGSENGTRKEESFRNYSLGFAQGKAGGHIDSFRFIWYKYCLKNSTMSEKNTL